MRDDTATDKAPETDWSRALRILRPESEQLAQWVTA